MPPAREVDVQPETEVAHAGGSRLSRHLGSATTLPVRGHSASDTARSPSPYCTSEERCHPRFVRRARRFPPLLTTSCLAAIGSVRGSGRECVAPRPSPRRVKVDYVAVLVSLLSTRRAGTWLLWPFLRAVLGESSCEVFRIPNPHGGCVTGSS